MSYEYARYLAAKTSVDDRALNRTVMEELDDLLPSGPVRVLEIGAGLGTMVARLLGRGIIAAGDYTLLDVDLQLLDASRQWLSDWADDHGLRTEPLPDGLRLGDLRVHLVHAELGRYLHAEHDEPADVLIANAFLDLVDVPTVLPGLLRLLRPGGVYWFTINYDGETVFEPGHRHDGEIMRAYHRDMDERDPLGYPAGESRTGRHLFHHLRCAGAPAVCSGPSDWLVHAGVDGTYPQDEAYFLTCILQTIGDALQDRVDPGVLADWLADRHAQVAAGDLLYIAHQLDFVGRSSR